MKATLAMLLFAGATAHAEPAAPLDLTIQGSIDPALLATSIATELRRPVTPRTDGCHAPCLAIAVDGQTATLTFTAPDGATRQRTLALPADAAAWPTVVTLLAGNLVRDEADELLPDEPAAAMPAPLAHASPPVLATERFSPFALSLVPGASTNLLDLQRSHVLSIGLVAEASGHVRGVAVSGAVDVADEVAGAQIAGALAIADESRGTQIAGGLTIARGAAGTQIAGGVNIAGTIHGVQIAPINLARHNAGLQIGVINVGGGADADAFGLINIVPGGRTDLEAAVDSDRIGTVMLRHGGRHWHNVYGVGGQHVDVAAGMPNNDVWMLGLGFGPSFHIAGLPADLDAIAWHVNHGSAFDDRLSLLAQARLTLAVPIGRASLVAGGAIDTYVSTDTTSPLAVARTTATMSNDVHVHVWPSAFVGVRL